MMGLLKCWGIIVRPAWQGRHNEWVAGDGDINNKDGNVGGWRRAKAECNVNRLVEGVVRQEVSRLEQNIVDRANSFSDGSQGAANHEYGIADRIVDWGLGA
jgi:hypothetical protein